MNFMSRFRIGNRILLSYVVILILLTTTSAISIVNLYNFRSQTEENYNLVTLSLVRSSNASSAFINIRVAARDMILSANSDEVNAHYTELKGFISTAQSNIDSYIKTLEANNITSGQEYSDVKSFSAKLNEYAKAVDKIKDYAVNHDFDSAKSELSANAHVSDEVTTIVNGLIKLNEEQSAKSMNEIIQASSFATLLNISLVIVAILLTILIGTLTSNSIVRPIKQLVEGANSLARGDLNANITIHSGGEIGVLYESFFKVISIFQRLIKSIDDMSKSHEEGDIDASIDANSYEGIYYNMASGLNNMVGSYISETIEILNCLNSFGNGDFNAPIKSFPGKKSVANDSIESLRKNLTNVSNNVQSLVSAASVGDLSKRIDANQFSGDWQKIIKDLDNLLNVISAPILESSKVMKSLAEGDFSKTVDGDYKGDFALIKNSLNSTTKTMSSYIVEISSVLTNLANDNFDQSIDKEYVGDFSTIKNALNNIIAKLNNVMSNITTASDQVATGAKQISQSSMHLAEGASEQSSTVQQLNATINSIHDKTSMNAENANNAVILSSKSKENAADGNSEMKNMLISMDGIKESSNNISKIIKVIEDIAFQTNLLALNAAVEAARAGEHGKGFAVVAEEVRNLAARSQQAAQETTELIEDSIQKVNEGTGIAKSTSEALEKIVLDISEVSGIITEIAAASNEQASAIAQINEGIGQISTVVQANSSTSEESAAAAQELSSQSEMLKQMMSVFKLKSSSSYKKSTESLDATQKSSMVPEKKSFYVLSETAKPVTTTKKPEKINYPDSYREPTVSRPTEPKKQALPAPKPVPTPKPQTSVTKPAQPVAKTTPSAITPKAPAKTPPTPTPRKRTEPTDNSSLSKGSTSVAPTTSTTKKSSSGNFNSTDFGKY